MGKIRFGLITSLVWAYRQAESYYIDMDNDNWKSSMDEVVGECRLTKTERNEFDRQCNVIGI